MGNRFEGYESMTPANRALSIFTVVIVTFTAFGANGVGLRVTSAEDPTKAFPGSRLYVARLVNHGSADMTVQAIAMPGGYVGSGLFFACTIEQRSKAGTWSVIRRNDLSDFRHPTLDRKSVV